MTLAVWGAVCIFRRRPKQALHRARCNLARAMSGDIAGMRKPYLTNQHIFDFEHLKSKDPFEQFRHWFDEAVACEEIHEANAMSLATATKSALPSVRIVLLKGFSSEGFVFYTNYESRKGRELAENPHCSLMFYWDALKRSDINSITCVIDCIHWNSTSLHVNGFDSSTYQYIPPLDKLPAVKPNVQVRVDGTVERVSDAESLKYFESRPRPSQLGAIVSRQGQVIPSREVLDKRHEELMKEYEDENKPIPKPDYWGGFLVRPERFEFWQGQSTRLHDRIFFRRPAKGETINPEVTHQGENGWVYERLSP